MHWQKVLKNAQEVEIPKAPLTNVSKLKTKPTPFQTRSSNLAIITPNSMKAYVAGENEWNIGYSREILNTTDCETLSLT